MNERRQFSHLTKTEIVDIVTAYGNGETRASIAQRLHIDQTTVTYHVRKHERSYPEEPNVYALIKVGLRKECSHPSMKCFLCGTAADLIHSRERDEITTLTARLARANSRLEYHGFDKE